MRFIVLNILQNYKLFIDFVKITKILNIALGVNNITSSFLFL
jgi:hypothetical protein